MVTRETAITLSTAADAVSTRWSPCSAAPQADSMPHSAAMSTPLGCA